MQAPEDRQHLRLKRVLGDRHSRLLQRRITSRNGSRTVAVWNHFDRARVFGVSCSHGMGVGAKEEMMHRTASFLLVAVWFTVGLGVHSAASAQPAAKSLYER